MTLGLRTGKSIGVSIPENEVRNFQVISSHCIALRVRWFQPPKQDLYSHGSNYLPNILFLTIMYDIIYIL